jgi:hypothetical protein
MHCCTTNLIKLLKTYASYFRLCYSSLSNFNWSFNKNVSSSSLKSIILTSKISDPFPIIFIQKTNNRTGAQEFSEASHFSQQNNNVFRLLFFSRKDPDSLNVRNEDDYHIPSPDLAPMMFVLLFIFYVCGMSSRTQLKQETTLSKFFF